MASVARAFLLVGTTMVGGLSLGLVLGRAAQAEGASPYAGLDTLARVWTTISNSYVDPISPATLSEGAIRGMVAELDPHSRFHSAEEYAALAKSIERSRMSIGVELRLEGAVVQISRVVPGGPAALAGVEVGDHILTVNGLVVEGQSAEAVAALLEGERGEAVLLGLERQGRRSQRSVPRDEVLDVEVDATLLERGYGLLRIHAFHRRVGADVGLALDRLQREGGPLQGLIVDLRGNPGGLMDEAVLTVDHFLPEGPLVETRGRDGIVSGHDRSTTTPDDLRCRLVVLIDGGTASAAEVVAGSLQDLGRATLIGERSYGKGSVQQIYELEDGSALRLTKARYTLPSGRFIGDHRGLDPDLVVPMPRLRSPAVERLRGELAALPIAEAERARLIAELDTIGGEGVAAPIPSGGELSLRLTEDPPLAAAWASLRSPR